MELRLDQVAKHLVLIVRTSATAKKDVNRAELADKERRPKSTRAMMVGGCHFGRCWIDYVKKKTVRMKDFSSLSDKRAPQKSRTG